MLKRLLSHLLITAAVSCLSATFFVWVIDRTVLAPEQLVPALQSAGVPGAIASALPELATQNDQTRTDPDVKPQDRELLKSQIATVVTPAYVDQKMQSIVESTLLFVKEGSPQPVLDMSDFPMRLKDAGLDVGSDIDQNFTKPVELNRDGKLNSVPQAYNKFKLFKYIGIVLFMVLLLAEWFVAERGKKLQRIGRIFLHAGLWYALYYIALIAVPGRALSKLSESTEQTIGMAQVVSSFTKGLQGLFGQYFLGFAAFCLAVAAALYLARHSHKHVRAIRKTTDPSPPVVVSGDRHNSTSATQNPGSTDSSIV